MVNSSITHIQYYLIYIEEEVKEDKTSIHSNGVTTSNSRGDKYSNGNAICERSPLSPSPRWSYVGNDKQRRWV